jgi:hypothetical protein
LLHQSLLDARRRTQYQSTIHTTFRVVVGERASETRRPIGREAHNTRLGRSASRRRICRSSRLANIVNLDAVASSLVHCSCRRCSAAAAAAAGADARIAAAVIKATSRGCSLARTRRLAHLPSVRGLQSPIPFPLAVLLVTARRRTAELVGGASDDKSSCSRNRDAVLVAPCDVRH